MTTDVRFCDEFDFGFTWIHPEPPWMERASHAISIDGSVWIIEPVRGFGVLDRIRSLGEPTGVLQLLGRHARDCSFFAEELAVPLYVIPRGDVPGLPLKTIDVARFPGWRESGLWWPEQATLVIAEAIGTAPHYLAGSERLAAHPFLRLRPPRKLAQYEATRLLVGHGAGIEGDSVPFLIEEALSTARRQIPTWLAGQLRRLERRKREK